MSIKQFAARLQSPAFKLVKDGGMFAKFFGSKFFACLIISGFVVSSHATNWYVDNAATGSSNGSSWANAWTSFSSIVWSSSGVKPGDTLFISGGTASKTYSTGLTVGASGNSDTSRITIRVGQETGHNGRVVINGNISLISRHYVTVDGEVNGARRISVSPSINCSSANYFILRYIEVHSTTLGIVGTYGSGGRVSGCYLYDIQEEAGIQFNARNYQVSGYDQTLIDNTIIQLNRYASGAGNGPDGIQGCWGLTVSNCLFTNVVGTITGAQHQDYIQMMANYVKIVGNRFISTADSCIDYDTFNGQPAHHLIYNNEFIMVRGGGIRYYGGGGATFSAMTDVHIFNNTFADHVSGHQWAFSIANIVGGSLTATDVSIQNNLFYNCISPVYIEAAGVATQSSYNFDYNLISAGTSGNTGVTVDGSSYTQAHPFGGTPVFVGYTSLNEASNLRLAAGDTAAKDKGTSLAAYFTKDKDESARPQGAAWDIGAFEYGGLTGGSTNPIISVASSGMDFGSLAVGTQLSLGVTVQNVGAGTLSGAASVAAPFSIVSGGSYNLASNQSQVVTIRYSPTSAGSQNQLVAFSGGGGVTLLVSGVAWVPLSGNSFSATAGTITSPFVANPAGYISQSSETTLATSGRAVYGFTVTNAGTYLITASINAPDDSANSLFINIDSEPTDPLAIWDVPVTAGFENRTAAWRGNGTDVSSQFNPKTFALSAGNHQLIVRGREANLQISQFAIVKIPEPPSNLIAYPAQ